MSQTAILFYISQSCCILNGPVMRLLTGNSESTAPAVMHPLAFAPYWAFTDQHGSNSWTERGVLWIRGSPDPIAS